jgi:dihydromethanopterin reductase (acceptor)
MREIDVENTRKLHQLEGVEVLKDPLEVLTYF